VAGPPREKGDTYASEEGSEKGSSQEGCEESRKKEVACYAGPRAGARAHLQVSNRGGLATPILLLERDCLLYKDRNTRQWLPQREIMLGISGDEERRDHLQAKEQVLIANCLDARACCFCL